MKSEQSSIAYQRQLEPREKAFSFLAPHGWLVEGGVVRADLMHQIVSMQTIACKIDLTVKRDPAGTVMFRWAPTYVYVDTRHSPAAQMGFFPPGSNYMGAIVFPCVPATQFILQFMFPWAHPNVSQPRVVEQKNLPELARKVQERQARLGVQMMGVSYDAGLVTYLYSEGGVPYKEKALTVIENMGQMAAGLWSNTDTIYSRAPADEYENWEPVFALIQGSQQVSPEWFKYEMQSQQVLSQAFRNAQQADIARSQRALETQRYIQDVDRQIVEHRQQTFAEIRNDMYLNMTNQEEYVNPFTQLVDVGSNQYAYRWVTESGDVFYTEHEGDNPNDGSGVMDRTDWKRSEVRPRKP